MHDPRHRVVVPAHTIRLLPQYLASEANGRGPPCVDFQHQSPLGSASDFAIIDLLTPNKDNSQEPSSAWSEYSNIGEAAKTKVETEFAGKFQHFGDLCEPAFINEVFVRNQ